MSYIIVPTYNNGVWTETEFDTRDDFKDFVTSVFKPEGPDEGYNFDETSLIFNIEAKKFQKNGFYCSSPFKSKDYINYWDDQKLKCKSGIIVKSGVNEWYISRDYYMWLNFLQIGRAHV